MNLQTTRARSSHDISRRTIPLLRRRDRKLESDLGGAVRTQYVDWSLVRSSCSLQLDVIVPVLMLQRPSRVTLRLYFIVPPLPLSNLTGVHVQTSSSRHPRRLPRSGPSSEPHCTGPRGTDSRKLHLACALSVLTRGLPLVCTS
jgi:hypothetical protein